MSIIIHRANTRGYADHGWLQTFHTFSFANYYDPERMGCGALRVLNDDTVQAGEGFGRHGHQDMEIFTIPLSGRLLHKDSLGHSEVIGPNMVQVMSAGKGVFHSEENASNTEPVSLLQIWIEPKVYGVEPRHETGVFNPADRRDHIQAIIAPQREGTKLWLHQDVYISWLDAEQIREYQYSLHGHGHGVYLFQISGRTSFGKEVLRERDGMWMTEQEAVSFSCELGARLLLIEVPIRV
jgi:redox-sensitive bicupin YhaK (pirin superfamily)